MTGRPSKPADVDAIDVGGERADGRRVRSQRTSARVLVASRDLFVDQGYARTTIEAIAARAGVTAQTVYNQFGTKCDVLAAVLDQAIVGDTAPVALLERPWFVVDDDEPAADAIARLAATATAILARVAPLYDVIRSASALPEVARLLVENRARRRADQRQVVAALARTGQLRPDLDVGHTADVVYGLVNEDVYLLLTVDCGWSRRRFQTWLAQTMVEQLIAPPDPPHAARRRRRTT
jgi:AcrR family transcriptional regulator